MKSNPLSFLSVGMKAKNEVVSSRMVAYSLPLVPGLDATFL